MNNQLGKLYQALITGAKLTNNTKEFLSKHPSYDASMNAEHAHMKIDKTIDAVASAEFKSEYYGRCNEIDAEANRANNSKEHNKIENEATHKMYNNLDKKYIPIKYHSHRFIRSASTTIKPLKHASFGKRYHVISNIIKHIRKNSRTR